MNAPHRQGGSTDQLQRQLAFATTIINTIGEGVCAVDQEGRVTFINPAASALLGWTRAALHGTPFHDAVHAQCAADVLSPAGCPLRVALQAPEPVHIGADVFTRQDGTALPVSYHVCPLRTDGHGRGAVLAFHDITARRQAEQHLLQLAYHDALTGSPNRTLLLDRLAQALLVTRPCASSLALLLIDLNHFKEVNDTLGHAAGDALLREVAVRLGAVLPASATVARLGGDEFAVLLPATDEQGAQEAAHKLLRALARPVILEGCATEVGASIGLALAPAHGADAGTLLRHADVAMYVAKHAGLPYRVYDPRHDPHTPARLTLAAELRRAITQGQLEVYYQPVVDLDRGRPISVEALVRWHHPDRGLLAPDQFIPLAEQAGVIVLLTQWVLDAALWQCRAWRHLGLPIGVAVNLSTRVLQDDALPDTILQLLRRHAVAPEWLTLEITESAVMTRAEQAATVLARLAALGVHLALDDFGTGQSSLSHLQRLPVDALKIDKSFVTHMTTNARDAALVSAILNLGHTLGLTVVVEGVETEGLWSFLSAIRCDADRAQGYFISRPLPAAEMTQWLRARLPAAA